MYFESHAHYDDRQFQPDRDVLLRDILPAAGVDYIVNIGCNIKSAEMSLRLAKKYDYVYAAVGIHPSDLEDISSQSIEKLRQLCQDPKCVAIGEIGLDYHFDDGFPKEVQRFWFRQQLRLAEEMGKSVVIHSRDASQETFDIIESTNVRKGVIHCYSGSWQMAEDYVKMGYHIGVGGVVTYSNAKKLVEVVEHIPLESILIETDSPYLAPTPNRGKRNDSANLKYVVEKIAEIKGAAPEDVAKITFDNAKKVFFAK